MEASGVPPSPTLSLAQQALHLVLASPSRARNAAIEAAAAAEASNDLVEKSLSQRALGLVAQHLEDFDSARDHYLLALRYAQRTKDPVLISDTRVGLAYFLSLQGNSKQALRQIVLARRTGKRSTAPWSILSEALVLKTLGRWDEALDAYRRALSGFRRSNDVLGQARSFANRAVVQIYRGQLTAAENDLQQADVLFEKLGQDLNRAIVIHNRGYIAARRGDIPTALSFYAAAEKGYREHREPPLSLAVDRCELLLTAGLAEEARLAAEDGVHEAERSRQAAGLAEARLRLAAATLSSGNASAAFTAADQAARAFSRQERPAWEALARWVVVQAQIANPDARNPPIPHVREVGRALHLAGWHSEALLAHIAAAELALQHGRDDEARADLEAASQGRRRGNSLAAIAGWYAEARLRLLNGRRTAAESALRAGMRRLEEHRASLGSTDLRTRIASHAADLARLGVDLAMSEGSAERTLRWVERYRAGNFRFSSVRPPDDPVLASALSELRLVSAELDAALVEGAPVSALRRRISQLEQKVRDQARQLVGEMATHQRAIPNVAELAKALGDAILVELIVRDDQLHAVVIRDGRASLHNLGDLAVAQRELEMVRFSLHRLLAGPARQANRMAAMQSLDYSARQLDAELLSPIAHLLETKREFGDGARVGIDRRPLVIVPTGPLHAVPWSVLPTCQGRPVTVAPSATSWHRAVTDGGNARSGSVVLVGGTGLAHADEEISALAAVIPDAVVLLGTKASTSSVITHLEGARLAHIAAHGRFRADNPLFSCLELSDGALTVYDLERLQTAPETIVLSACDSGLSVVQPGDELMGLAAALLTMGTRTLVASVVPVPDDTTRELMTDFNARLHSGDGPAAALAWAQMKRRQAATPVDIAAASGFVCFGAG